MRFSKLKMRLILKSQGGHTLLKLLSQLAVGLPLLAMATHGFINVNRSHIGTLRSADDESSRRLLRSELSSYLKSAITEPVLMSQPLANLIGIDTQIGLNFAPLPPAQPLCTVCGSLITVRSRRLTGTSGTNPLPPPPPTPPKPELDLLVMLTLDPAIPALMTSTADPEIEWTDTVAVSGATLSIKVDASGDYTKYKAGDVLAIRTPSGVELMPLTANPITNILKVSVKYALLPVRHLSPGTPIYKLRTLILGADDLKFTPRIVVVAPSTNTYRDLIRGDAEVNSLEVWDRANILQGTVKAVSTTPTNFLPLSTQNTLRAEWQRAQIASPVALPPTVLEVGL